MTNIILMLAAVVIFALSSIVFIAIWVYKDARQGGLQAGLWALLVILSGTFIGLLLYLIIGRKQGRGICDQCGAAVNTQGTFCHVCGGKMVEPKHRPLRNKGLLIACVACIVLAFLSLGTLLYSSVTADGFMPLYSYNSYNHNLSGSAKNVSQSRSGDTWEFSFDEATSGYTFSTSYNAATKPTLLDLDIKCTGEIQLLITQDSVSIIDTLTKGNYRYDMTTFESGKISIELINIDATDLSGKVVVKTEG